MINRCAACNRMRLVASLSGAAQTRYGARMNDKMDIGDQSKAPPGWSLFSTRDTFSGHAGPFWFRSNDQKTPGVGFVSRPVHANFHGVVHGGVLMTLADMTLFNICFHAVGPFQGVTLSTTVDLIAAGPIGEFIEATGEATKATGSILFARGEIVCRGARLATFSGSLKRITPRGSAQHAGSGEPHQR